MMVHKISTSRSARGFRKKQEEGEWRDEEKEMQKQEEEGASEVLFEGPLAPSRGYPGSHGLSPSPGPAQGWPAVHHDAKRAWRSHQIEA